MLAAPIAIVGQLRSVLDVRAWRAAPLSPLAFEAVGWVRENVSAGDRIAAFNACALS